MCLSVILFTVVTVQVVLILLECILVFKSNSVNYYVNNTHLVNFDTFDINKQFVISVYRRFPASN